MNATRPATPSNYRFTVDEYYQMAEAGIFGEDDPVELIEGEIIEMSPEGSPHAACISKQAALFHTRLTGRAIVRAGHPMRLDNHSEPEPDLAVVRPRDDWYASGHPGPEDILLAIEVAHSSLAFDRNRKVPHYGRRGIPESWLWDLPGQCLHVFRDPGPEGYATVTTYRGPETVSPLAFPDLQLRVDEIL